MFAFAGKADADGPVRLVEFTSRKRAAHASTQVAAKDYPSDSPAPLAALCLLANGPMRPGAASLELGRST